MQEAPQQQYRQELERQTMLLENLEKKRARLGWLRFGVFIIAALLSYKVFSFAGLLGLLPATAGIAGLLYLVSIDLANNTKIRNTKTLIGINQEELNALRHQFFSRDDGKRFLPSDHPYAVDLDIFGTASVYQWLSRSYTEQGQSLLAQNLLQPQPVQLIYARQEAVKELAPQLQWRQQFQAFAMQATITRQTENRVKLWLSQEEKYFSHPAWKVAVNLYSLATVASLTAFVFGYISASVFSGLFLLYSVLSATLSRNTIKPYVQLNGIAKETATLQKLLAWLEGHAFTSTHLRTLHDNLKHDAASASEEIKSLSAILDRFDLRLGIVGILFLNPFLLWDVRQMFALNGWRQRNKTQIPLWFTVVAEAELLHSISTACFNQPAWCFPTFTPEHFVLRGTNIGHPLLSSSQRVTNNFTLNGHPKIAVVTGSNMAGKSTFLRSLGVNAVLAQMGAPVCASEFELSPVNLLSSMRISDNLAENTSTFYAELKKLRTIIEKVKAKEYVFILLDEILRGTNSLDRHKGSMAFIKQLMKEQAVAVIATHDVELAGMKDAHSAVIENYHFDVEVEGEELYFDYKLKGGVCTSLNASILMKKIGIDLDE